MAGPIISVLVVLLFSTPAIADREGRHGTAGGVLGAGLVPDDGPHRIVLARADKKDFALFKDNKHPALMRIGPRSPAPHRSPRIFEARFPRTAYVLPRNIDEPDPKPYTSTTQNLNFSSVFTSAASDELAELKIGLGIAAAFATHVALHELGHDIVADRVGAQGADLKFLTTRDGQFFLGSSTVEKIENRSRLPYSMGGEVAADLTFEYALESYRNGPNPYNSSLLFFSGTDLFWYSIYAFYFSDGHEELDPVAITKFNNISRGAVLSAALVKTVINAYRVHTGRDTLIAHFSVGRDSVVLNFRVPF